MLNKYVRFSISFQLLIGHVRATVEDGGPPPWVPFGRKVQQIPLIEKEPKEELTDKDKEEKDEEFLSQRQDAIKAAVDNAGKTKVVKGSGKQVNIYVILLSYEEYSKFYENLKESER